MYAFRDPLAAVALFLLVVVPSAYGVLVFVDKPPAIIIGQEAGSPFPGFSGDENPQSQSLRQVALGYQGNRTGFLLGADLDYQSHRASLEVPLEMRLRLLDVILEAEPDLVRVTPSYEPWLPAFWTSLAPLRDYMDNVVAGIRASGAKLMIADGAAEYYWEHPMDWESFRSAFISRVKDMAQRYQPEYYVVVKEPEWYGGLTWGKPGGMLSEPPSVTEWLDLTEAACDAVKQVSPSTITMVSMIPGDPQGGGYYPESRQYFRAAHEISGLDVVGVDIYKVADLYRFDAMLADLDGVPEKPHWILETWDGNPDEQTAEWRLWSHADWLAVITRYASWHRLQGVVTFYSRCFCYIGSGKPGSTEEWNLWLDQRTPAFEIFREMAITDHSLVGCFVLLVLAFLLKFFRRPLAPHCAAISHRA